MDVETAYYQTPFGYEPGHVVMPGQWGRALLAVGAHENLTRQELTIEYARRLFAPERPSRFDCVFVFPTKYAATGWDSLPGDPQPERYVYRVTYDSALLTYTASLDLLDQIWHQHSLQGVDEALVAYWHSGADSANPDRTEILVAGPMEIAGLEGTVPARTPPVAAL